jgi:hypothetical protein
LNGNVIASGGEKLAGVAVTARAQGETFSTTVFSIEDGTFSFPVLAKGKYSG